MTVKYSLFSVNSAFQDHTERMRKKLANQKQQQVDDEDDRIAKAVAERERKREVRQFAWIPSRSEDLNNLNYSLHFSPV